MANDGVRLSKSDDTGRLVLTFRVGEGFAIDGLLRVIVVHVKGKAKLVIEAPKSIKINRTTREENEVNYAATL